MRFASAATAPARDGGVLRGKPQRGRRSLVKELFRTNDIVLLSFARAKLRDHGIRPIVLDSHMSVVEGSLGILPRRLMIHDDDEHEARLILGRHGIECSSDV